MLWISNTTTTAVCKLEMDMHTGFSHQPSQSLAVAFDAHPPDITSLKVPADVWQVITVLLIPVCSKPFIHRTTQSTASGLQMPLERNALQSGGNYPLFEPYSILCCRNGGSAGSEWAMESVWAKRRGFAPESKLSGSVSMKSQAGYAAEISEWESRRWPHVLMNWF